MSEITDLRDAIRQLTSTITGSAASSGGKSSGGIQGVTQGITETLITQTVSPLNKVAKILEKQLDWRSAWKADKRSASEKIAAGPFDVANKYGQAMKKQMDTVKFESDREVQTKKTGTFWLDKFTSWLKRGTLALVAFAGAGLAGTVEGFKLSWAFKNLFYQIADLIREPIRFLIYELNELAKFISKLRGGDINKANAQADKEAQPFSAGVQYALANNKAKAEIELKKLDQDVIQKEKELEATKKENKKWNWGLGTAEGEEKIAHAQTELELSKARAENLRKKIADIPKDAKPKDIDIKKPWATKVDEKHIQPLYTTQFMALTQLWENMNKMVTENPGLDAQEKTASNTQAMLDIMRVNPNNFHGNNLKVTT